MELRAFILTTSLALLIFPGTSLGALTCYPACGENEECVRGRCVCRDGFYESAGGECIEGCTCTAEGDPHYKKFDFMDKKEKYTFQGPCKYLLSSRQSSVRPECNYRLEAKNEYRDNDIQVTNTEYITVYLPNKDGDVIQMGPMDTVTVNGVSSKDYRSADGQFTINYFDKQWILKTQCEVEIAWNGNNRARISVPRDFEDLTGMCGDCNGDVANECSGPMGESYMRTDTGRCDTCSWGLSWEVEDPTEEQCDGFCESFVTTCAADSKATAEAACSILNLSQPDNMFLQFFQSNGYTAEEIANIQKVMGNGYDVCVYDSCNSIETGSNPTRIVCQSVQAAVEDAELSFVDKFPSWRTDTFCAPQCGPNEEYVQVRNEASCVLKTSVLSPTDTDPGCACKAGFARSGTECVPDTQCGCTENGRYYMFGDEFVTDDCRERRVCDNQSGTLGIRKVADLPACGVGATCTTKDGQYQCVCDADQGLVGDGFTCTAGCGSGMLRCHPQAECVRFDDVGDSFCVCKNGMSGDGINFCGDTSKCAIWGDPHIDTWTDERLDYMGPCTYRLAEIKEPAECAMSVRVKNFPSDDDTSVAKLLYIQTPDGNMIKFGKRKSVYLNGEEVNADIETANYWVYQTTSHVIYENSCGMKAAWDGRTKGYVETPTQYCHGFYGLCGPCDVQKYQWITFDNVDVTDQPNRVNLIGDSQLVESEPGFAENCKEYNHVVPTCSAEVQARGVIVCGKLISTEEGDPFAECLSKDLGKMEEANKIYEGCLYDFCAFSLNEPRQKTSVCTAFGSIHEMCIGDYNVEPWRTDDFCPASDDLECDASKNMVYSARASSCQKTCEHPRGPKRCKDEPGEGCVCSDSAMLYDPYTHGCVHHTDCGMRINGKYYPLGTNEVLKGCRRRMRLEKVGGVVRKMLERFSCDKNTEKCGLENGKHACVCRNGLQRIDGKCQVPQSPTGGSLPVIAPTEQLTAPASGTLLEPEKTLSGELPLNISPENGPESAPELIAPQPESQPGETLPSGSLPQYGTGLQLPQIWPSGANGLVGPFGNLPQYGQGVYPPLSGNFPWNAQLPQAPVQNPIPATGSDDKNQPRIAQKSEEILAPCEPEEEEIPYDQPAKPATGPYAECCKEDDPKCENYWGSISVTRDGKKCQSWASSRPHSHPFAAVLGSEDNKCRNRPYEGTKGLRETAWCYTTDPNEEWGYCDIPTCENEKQAAGLEEPSPVPTAPTVVDVGCYNATNKGEDYSGMKNTGKNGEACDNWTDNGMPNMAGDENFCRNPGQSQEEPWCFSGGVEVMCGVPQCDEQKDPEEQENPPACSVETKQTLCGTVTTLTGSCELTFNHDDDCKFSVVQKSQNKYKVHLPLENVEAELNFFGTVKSHVSTKCGTFKVPELNKVEVTSPNCGMCMKSSFSNIMPDPEAYSLSPTRGFCKAP